MYVWMNKTHYMVLAVPCTVLGKSTSHGGLTRLQIAIPRRMSGEIALDVKEVLRKNIYYLRDYLKVRREMTRGEHEHERAFNARIERALEAARVQGAIERV